VINIAKDYQYFDLLSYSYKQVASCYQELDEINKSNDIIYDGIEFFSRLFQTFEEKNDNLAISQISQVLKSLYQLINEEEQFVSYSKKEAGAYINLAERLEKNEGNYRKIATYYRGAALCYKEINNNLIESASCFVLAGNYSEKVKDYNEAATNFFNAAVTFKELNNLEMTYKHYVKAGDNYWKIENVNDSTECYLNAYDIAVEGDLEYNRFGIFNQIIRGLNIIAKEGLKNKQFYTAATLIMESIKFYQQLDTAKDFLLNEMVKNVYRYYYRAANLKKIGPSHIVQSYVLAAISSILNGKNSRALEIMSEVEFEGNTVNKYKELIKLIIDWISEGKKVELKNFPYDLQRIVQNSEDIKYLLKLFKGYKLPS
jgi:tetratricopeptide (TPR) repeat protein